MERASTDANYPRVPASQSYFEEGEGRGDGENSVTIIKTADIVSGGGDRFDGAAADR